MELLKTSRSTGRFQDHGASTLSRNSLQCNLTLSLALKTGRREGVLWTFEGEKKLEMKLLSLL